MSEIIFGKDILTYRENIELVDDFLEMLDPNGVNVIIDKEAVKEGILCRCLFKFINHTEPIEASILLSKEVFKKIALNFDINTMLEVQ